MIRILCACVLVASALPMDGAALGADQFASAEEARAMLDRAVIALKANEAAALKAFNDEKNKSFRDRDLYIFFFSLPDGKFTAYQSALMLGTLVGAIFFHRSEDHAHVGSILDKHMLEWKVLLQTAVE